MVIDDVALNDRRLTYVAVTFTRPTLAYNEGTQLRLLGIFFFFNLTHKHALNNLQASTPFLPWGHISKIDAVSGVAGHWPIPKFLRVNYKRANP